MEQHKIGDCIAKFRKEKGWTQNDLADKLQVSNKAVSKWESNKGEPSIEFLPRLAELFGITLDCLMTGKEVKETINYDDMDSKKRAIKLINNDDVKNFIKYGYNNDSILFEDDIDKKRACQRFMLNAEIRKAIYANESKKIFSVVVDEFINSKKVKDLIVQHDNNLLCLIEHLNEIDAFIKMCALTNRVDILEKVKFHELTVVNDTATNISVSNLNYKYLIRESTFDYLLTNKEIGKDVLKFICQIDVSQSKEICQKNDEIIYRIYKAHQYLYLDKILALYNSNADEVIKSDLSNEEKARLFNYDTNRNYFLDVRPYQRDYSSIKLPYPILKAFNQAKEDDDLIWIEKFNAYNKKLAQQLNVTNSNYLPDNEIKLLKMRNDKKTKIEELILFKHTNYKLLSLTNLYHSLFQEMKQEQNENEIEFTKRVLKESKKIFDEIKNSSICYRELVEKCIAKKNYKVLFELATDNNLIALQDAVISANNDEIRKVCENLFGYTKNDLDNYARLVCEREQSQSNNPNIVNVYAAVNLSNYEINFIKEKQNQNALKNNKNYEEMLKLQIKNCPFNLITDDVNISKQCDELRKNNYEAFVKKHENLIEAKTHEQANAREFERIQNEISFDYLRNEIKDGHFENAVIKLCVRLEAILKYKYKYEGDLFKMMDTYTLQHLQWRNAWDDDYDGANEEADYKKEMLHKLRLVRNGIVHAEKNNVNFNNDDLYRCIKIVEKM